MMNSIKDETVADIFVRQMDFYSMSTAMVANELGFGTANVISLIRTGRMKLPTDRVIRAARLLQIDPIYLLRVMARENKETNNDDRLLEVLAIATGQEILTKNEWELVKLYRQHTGGRDVDLAKHCKEEWGVIKLAMEEAEQKIIKSDIEFAARPVKKTGKEAGYKRQRRPIPLEKPKELTTEQKEAQEAAELKALVEARKKAQGE